MKAVQGEGWLQQGECLAAHGVIIIWWHVPPYYTDLLLLLLPAFRVYACQLLQPAYTALTGALSARVSGSISRLPATQHAPSAAPAAVIPSGCVPLYRGRFSSLHGPPHSCHNISPIITMQYYGEK